MADRSGQQIGNYRLIRLLGKGGFAEVYLAVHVHLGSQAAIKLLHAALASAEELDQFRLEAQTIVALTHPHIVRILDFGVEDGTPYLVMDYAPNGSLRQRLPANTPLPPASIAGYLAQVADALQYAHEHQLVHRDVKPENLLLGRNHEVLLTDFGIATVAQHTSQQRTEGVAGTAAYMAPEQLQGKPRPASDLYALGVVVYEWLCGARPFAGAPMEVATQHVLTPPPPPREKAPDLPESIERVVLTALAKDPKERFGSVRAFANAFQQACAEAGIVADSAPALLPLPPAPITSALPVSQPGAPISAPRAHITPQLIPQGQTGPVQATGPTGLFTPDPTRLTPSGQLGQTGPSLATGPTGLFTPDPTFRVTDPNMPTAGSSPSAGQAAAPSDQPILAQAPMAPGTFVPAATTAGRRGGTWRWGAIAAAALVLLVLLGSGTVYGLSLLFHPASATATPTSAPFQTSGSRPTATFTPPPTPTFTPTPTATSTPTPTPIPPAAGTAWTVQTSGTSGDILYTVAWSGSRYVTTGTSGTILTSTDGRTWTAAPSASQALPGLVWSGSQFVAVGGAGAVYISSDGLNWNPISPPTSHAFLGVTWSGPLGQFVAVGDSGIIYTSPNGSNWTLQTPPTSQNILNVIWGGTQYVAVGDNGTILTSPDGHSWTLHQVNTSASRYLGITWSGSQYVVTGYNGTILTSPNGSNWTARTSGTSQILGQVVWSGSQYVIAGFGGTILTSPDGRSWTAQNSNTSQDLDGIVWSGSQYVIVGYYVTILTSP